MKKLFLICAMVCALGVINGYAQNEDSGRVVKTFYGIKANVDSNSENPCKGLCLLKCGTVESNVTPVFTGPVAVEVGAQCVVRNTVKDADGNVISTNVKVYPGDVKTVVEMLQNEVIGKANVTVDCVECNSY